MNTNINLEKTMKEKIKIIVLIFIFAILLIGTKMLMDNQNKVVSGNVIVNKNEQEKNSQNMEEEIMESNVLEVTGENFETEVLKETKTVLIDFYADWCGPCQVLSPIVEAVAKSNTNIKVVRINIDNAESLAIEYGVMSIPTLVVIKDGKEIKRSVGLISQSEVEELVK